MSLHSFPQHPTQHGGMGLAQFIYTILLYKVPTGKGLSKAQQPSWKLAQGVLPGLLLSPPPQIVLAHGTLLSHNLPLPKGQGLLPFHPHP